MMDNLLAPAPAQFDWAASYASWDEYCKQLQPEEVVQVMLISSCNYYLLAVLRLFQLDLPAAGPEKPLADRSSMYPSHCYDHSEERKIFELPEAQKMDLCERHRLMVARRVN